MIQTRELTIEEYAKSLKKTKRKNLESICLYHIELVRKLEKELAKLRGTVPDYLGQEPVVYTSTKGPTQYVNLNSRHSRHHNF